MPQLHPARHTVPHTSVGIAVSEANAHSPTQSSQSAQTGKSPRTASEAGPIDVSVCIANWNCRDYLRNCLASLREQQSDLRIEVIVVDNASTDGAAEMVQDEFPEVVLICNDENRGFAIANNQAASRARGQFVFFLNNDTIIPRGALVRMLRFAQANPQIGMIGPRLRDGEGQLQISFRERPTIGALLHRILLFRWTGIFRSAYRQYRRECFDSLKDRPVEILMGAAVFMRRDVFESCGRWDEGYRFGGEDIDLSERVGRSHPLVYLASVEITHFGRVSSRQNVQFATPNVAIGYVRYFRKAGSPTWALLGYKLMVTIDSPLRVIAKAGQYLTRRITSRPEKAKKSLLALEGAWRFFRHDLVRFWRA